MMEAARKLVSDIGATIMAHPAFKHFFPPPMTAEVRKAKEAELESLKYIGDCLLSDGWNKGVKPLIDKVMQQYDNLSDSDSIDPKMSEMNRQRRIGLKHLLRKIEEETERAHKLSQELNAEEKP